jgi:5-methylcytosine-specific restriction endonuclease McrA
MRPNFRVAKISAKSFRKEKYSSKPSSVNGWYEARDKRLRLDNNTCQEEDCGSKRNISVHHKIPVSHGGSHAMSNLVTLCVKCHNRQHKHLMKLSWMKK